MRDTLKIINQLKTKRLLLDYAIGGGTGILFYTEAFPTYDLDIFVVVKQANGLLDFSPIFRYLTGLGYKWKGEHIIVEGTPVQFIPTTPLTEEAVNCSRVIRFEGIRAKVLSPEYLLAVLLQTGRPKDKIRAELLLRQTELDRSKLRGIFNRFQLETKYTGWFGDTQVG